MPDLLDFDDLLALDAQDRLAIRARAVIRAAVESGQIKRRSCSQCGTRKAEPHHDDYKQPLAVRWLCKRHHHDEHLTSVTRAWGFVQPDASTLAQRSGQERRRIVEERGINPYGFAGRRVLAMIETIASLPAIVSTTNSIAVITPGAGDPWDTFRSRRSRNTQRAYAVDLDQFLSYLGIGPRDYDAIKKVTPADIAMFLESRSVKDDRGRIVNAATVSRKLTAVRMLFKWYRACGVVDRNPAEVLQAPSVSRKSPRHGLTREEARAIVDATMTRPICMNSEETVRRGESIRLRDRAIVLFMLRAGLRREEVAQLNIGDLHDAGGIYAVFVRGKGDKVRTVPVHEEVANAVAMYLNHAGRVNDMDNQPLFRPAINRVSRQGTMKHVGAAYVFNIVVNAARRARIKKKISPHSLRHTAITLALDAGAKLERVQHMAGHADPSTTIRYFRTADDLKKSPIKLIDF